MKLSRWKVVVTATIVTSLVLAILCSLTQPVNAQETRNWPYYSVEPASMEFGPAPCVGQEFTVAVWLHNVTAQSVPAGAYGVEFKLRYDSTYLANVSKTPKVGLAGGVLNSPTFLAKNIWVQDVSGSYFWLAGASLPPAAAWWGDGKVAEVTFKIIKQPQGILGEPDVNTILDLFFTDLVDYDSKPVPHGPDANGPVSDSVTIHAAGHDVAIISVTAWPTAVPQGEPVYIDVEVENQGTYAETFSVSVYADRVGEPPVHVFIENRTVSLDIGESRLLDFVWDTTGVPYGSYWITAEAILPTDENPANNIGRAWVGGICAPHYYASVLAIIVPIISAMLAIVALGIIAVGFFKLLAIARPLRLQH